jgi:general secretion pathway protein H
VTYFGSASRMHGGRQEGGFTPSRRSAQQGFTLVELMVVIVIISLAASVVVLSMPDPGGGVAAEAERFAARAKAARDLAIVEARPAAIQVDSSGYQVTRRVRGQWQAGERVDWERGTAASGGETRFDATGLARPASLLLTRGDRQASVEIRGDGTVHVRR